MRVSTLFTTCGSVLFAAALLVAAAGFAWRPAAAQGQAPELSPTAQALMSDFSAELMAAERAQDWIQMESVANGALSTLKGLKQDVPYVAGMVFAKRGYAYFKQGRLKEAEADLRKALAIAESLAELDKGSQAVVLVDLADVLAARESPREAESYYRRAIALHDTSCKAYDGMSLEQCTDAELGIMLPGSYSWTVYSLGKAVHSQGRLKEAETLLRRALQVGPREAEDATAILSTLAENLEAQGRKSEIPALRAESLGWQEKGADQLAAGNAATNVMQDQQGGPIVALAEIHACPFDEALLASLTMEQLVAISDARLHTHGPQQAEPWLRCALAVTEGEKGTTQAALLVRLGSLLERQGLGEMAVPVLHQGIAAVDTSPPEKRSYLTASALNILGRLAMDGYRFADAERYFSRAVTMAGGETASVAELRFSAMNGLAEALASQGRHAEAEAAALQRRSEREDTDALLAHAIRIQTRSATEAEGVFRMAVAKAEADTSQTSSFDSAIAHRSLAENLEHQRRWAEAKSHYEKALSIQSGVGAVRWRRMPDGFNRMGPSDDEELLLERAIARVGVELGGEAELVPALRFLCALRPERPAESQKAGLDESRCQRYLARALHRLDGAQGAGEGFVAAQRTIDSVASRALARSSARALVAAAGLETKLESLDVLQAQLASLDEKYAAAEPSDSLQRTSLGSERNKVAREAQQLQQEIARAVPAYGYALEPEPTALEALRFGTPGRQPLLKTNEALVLWSTGPGSEKGLVFAVSRKGVGSALIPLSGHAIDDKVSQLRAQIDPGGRGLRGGLAVDGASPRRGTAFNRSLSHDLYKALLDHGPVRDVIYDPAIDTVLFVSSGSLTALPPTLLVVETPAGSDDDPAALRNTRWFIRERAVAVLPSVSSLNTLRHLLPAARKEAGVKTDLPLLMFANPDFSGRRFAKKTAIGATEDRGKAAPIEQTRMLPKLSQLTPLPGTLSEGRAVAKLLGARSEDLLLADAASESALRLRQKSGALSRVRTLGFATHGLVAGDLPGLTQPALALAYPAPRAHPAEDDGLLTASEAAGLRLNADWVLLSACNTASADGAGGEALSGLARAFFHAGANSLLVSHWRVRDDAAEIIVTETFRLQSEQGLGKAQALRQAMLKLLADTSRDATAAAFAMPQAWAPFTLVGEAQ